MPDKVSRNARKRANAVLADLNDQSLVNLPERPTPVQLRKELDRLRMLAGKNPGNAELNLNIAQLKVRIARKHDPKARVHFVQGGNPDSNRSKH